MKKILALAFLAIIVSSCGGKMKQDQIDSENQSTQQQDQTSQNPQNFDVVNSESAAAAINKQTQAAIEEVQVDDRVFFDVGVSTLSADAKKILDNQVSWLKSDPQIKIIVEGHCDERGTREYNIALGEKRANAVKQYLTSNGVESGRIKTISYGKERPAFVGSGEEIWSKNRRSVTVMEE
ncbi:MAG: peptidoglycan-associated lipoprotein Pal [Pseudomonadota bacterium]